MIKKLLLFLTVSLFFVELLNSQTINGKPLEIKYRRSSLHTILMESNNFPYKDTVIRAYNNSPFPDKYNNHTIGEKSFNPYKYQNGYTISDPNTEKPASDNSNQSNGDNYKFIIDNYFKQEKIANKLVAKWFDRKEDGTFDMDLIGQRGSYNASEMAAKIASSSARGLASLADAGEELIGNTFVVVSRLNFVSNEVPAAAARAVAYFAADRIPSQFLSDAAKALADVAYEKTREGYSVWTTSYLYKLQWNDSIAAVFYNDLWMDKSKIDAQRKAKFDNSDIFGMEFVGSEKSSTAVLFSGDKSPELVVEVATVRTVDNVYAKLQKKYDVFKTKTPLYSGEPITAKIGLKEGIEGGDKFEVLEQVLDKEGKTKYERKGVIKVNGKKIWDNRFNAGDGQKVDTTASSKEPKLDRTFFKGGKNYYSGMLIRQIK